LGNLETMSGMLGITIDLYFELIRHPKYSSQFCELITESLRANMPLREYWDVNWRSTARNTENVDGTDFVDVAETVVGLLEAES